jgi:hypothetical protein
MSGFGITLLLMPVAAVFGALYGYIGYAGYHKDIHRDDPERKRDVLITTGFAIVSVLFFRHVPNGDFGIWLIDGFDGLLKHGNPIILLFFGVPIAFLVMAVGVFGIAGSAMFTIKAIWRVLYYLKSGEFSFLFSRS